jgi:hypothetical protein
MTFLQGLGIFLIIWGILALIIGILRPAKLWKIGKIQGFVQLLGDTGTQILFSIMGVIAIVGGILILV